MNYNSPREQLESAEWNEHQADSANHYYSINAQQLAKTPVFLDTLKAPDGFSFVQLDYCLVDGTEVLTTQGWKLFQDLTEKDVVWQVDPNTLEGSWTSPQRIISRQYKGTVYTYGNVRGELTTTYGHTMLWAGQQTHARKDKARLRKINKSEEGIPRTATTMLTSSAATTVSNFSTEEIWTACMIAADGSKTPYGKYTIEVSKRRKRDKIQELLGRAGIVRPPRQNQTVDSESWYGIEFHSDLLGENKNLELTLLGANQADVFADALSFWDSYKPGNSTGRFNFSSTSESEIDEIQTYLVTSGYEARKLSRPTKQPQHTDAWELSIRKSAGIRLRPNFDESVSDYNGLVGCVTVDTGFIQVRYKGQTFITGNCALEPTVLAEFSQDKCYQEIYASGKPHDIYFYVTCKLLDSDGKINAVYNIDNPTKESAAAAKKQFKPERTIGKVFHLMSTYKAGAPTIHRKLTLEGVDLTRQQVKEIRDRYWGPELFGGILDYEEGILAEVDQRDGWFFNGLGRPFAVIDRKRKDVLNTMIQSSGHDITDLFIREAEKLFRERKIDTKPVIPDYHDETMWMVADAQRDAAAKCLSDAVEVVNDLLQFKIRLKGEPEITKTFTEFKGPDPVSWYAEKVDA